MTRRKEADKQKIPDLSGFEYSVRAAYILRVKNLILTLLFALLISNLQMHLRHHAPCTTAAISFNGGNISINQLAVFF